MNIEEMIWNGASEEEIEKALAEVRAKKAQQEEALRAEEKKNNKEALKAEARAYLINAILAYSEAFDLGGWSDEDVAKIESALKRFEDMIPMYLKIMEMQDQLDEDLFKGLF